VAFQTIGNKINNFLLHIFSRYKFSKEWFMPNLCLMLLGTVILNIDVSTKALVAVLDGPTMFKSHSSFHIFSFWSNIFQKCRRLGSWTVHLVQVFQILKNSIDPYERMEFRRKFLLCDDDIYDCWIWRLSRDQKNWKLFNWDYGTINKRG